MEKFSKNEIPKQFEREKEPEILSLGKDNIREIVDVENKSWIPGLQASEESILLRIENGHKILGIYEGEKLVGKICFSYSSFSPSEQEKFPATFHEFSNQPRIEVPNAVFIYNLDIDPQYRGGKYAPALIQAALEEAQKSGCRFIVADGRPSSYNGSNEFGQEQVKQNPEFKNAIDSYLNGGRFPTDQEFMKDPTLALYKRLTDCKFLWVLPEFIPEDNPAGGIRVILMKEIERQSEITLSEEWIALSEAMYGPDFVNELTELMEQNRVKTVLECGCGGGHILRGLGERGFTGLGVDTDKQMIEMAKSKNNNQAVDFQNFNWLELDKISEKFDMVMCRGNSLSSVGGWGGSEEVKIDAQERHELVSESLKKMYGRLKKGGLFYVDTISQDEIEQNDRDIKIDIKEIHLKGYRKFNPETRTVLTFGEGEVNGKFFKGGNVSYLIYPEELVSMLEKLDPEKIWTPKLKGEINYQIFCVKKRD